MIEVKNLCKTYGNHNAVADLTFTIGSGHIYGFLGPNGAGKSTTMNIITGCLAATSGSVTVDGFDILENGTEAKKAYRVSAGTASGFWGYDAAGISGFCC